MNSKILIGILATAALIGASVTIFVYSLWQKNVNPYESDGLNIEWDNREEELEYPWINVWVEHSGERIAPDLKFGGMKNPQLHFVDYNEDGRRDIVFGNDLQMQVVGFYRDSEESLPRFEILRNDVASTLLK